MKITKAPLEYISIAVATVGMFLLSAYADAQDRRWSVELRPAANFAMEKLGNTDLKPGFGTEVTGAYRFMEHLSIYAGWGWNQFTPDIENAGHYEETGYTFGLRFVHPINDRLKYMVAVGSVYDHLELENNDGEIVADTGHGFGWQAEAGIAIPVGGNWRITPGVRYRALSRDLTINEFTTTLDLRYISAGVGVAILF